MDARPPSGTGQPAHRLHWSVRLSALQRQGLALLAALAGAVVAMRQNVGGPEVPWLAGWLAYSLAYLGIAWRLALPLDATATRRRARWNDPGAAALFMLVAGAACASIVAVALAVESSRALQGLARWSYLALAMAALAASWLLLQTVFALHYARVYYRSERQEQEPARGLDFPGGQAPDYLDFLYFSAVIGMTSQVSDVTVSSRRMRRLTLVHGLLSFAFNLIVLALAVNVVAGSLG
ncbi:DUF1345 domain-containing protein [Pseudorhodoferax sp.]|uniref:DUF1345 domain-containing protein n=1 Tax=Pseudorhodoferax sp. TaxID=1993553 RepID=UPI0039E34BB8